MGTIGILHSGSAETAQQAINEFTNLLKKEGKKLPVIEVPDWNDNLSARAKSLIQKKVPVLLVYGGSRAAHAALHSRGAAKAPVVVFSNVAPYILDEVDDWTVTTGVCAHTSDRDDDRLDLLLKMVQHDQPKIGVLWNSNRGDTGTQWQEIADEAEGRCTLVSANLNGPLTMRKAFELFDDEKIDALLVAADPFFFKNRQEVVDRANRADYPAIYQWREFVSVGGLMSFGSNRDKGFTLAAQMAYDISEGGQVPPVYNVPDDEFELVVSRSKATHFNRWPLPASIASDPRLAVV